MGIDEQIAKELDSLVAEVPSLLKLAKRVEDLITFSLKYQGWYSRSKKLVELLGSDRLSEFCGYYLIDPKRKLYSYSTYVIQDYIKAVAAATDFYDKPKWDINETVSIRIVNQSQILESLKTRLDSVLSDVEGHLLANIEDDELATATRLIKINLRAAGAIAGVVLEGHLQRVAKNHRVCIAKKDPTIGDLNDPIKAAGIYDIPIWRKIQHLSDIRNLCDHKKNREPLQSEVEELISGTSSIIKTVF